MSRRDSIDGETAKEYIMALHRLAENCDYQKMTDELICDRLVVGIQDTSLSEKLQIDLMLMLAAAIWQQDST